MLLITTSVFLFNNSHSQNLIQNSSFENSTNVDCYGGFYDGTLPNAHTLVDWYQFNSPDYFSSSCGPGGYSVPNSLFGYSAAKQGSAFVGFGGYAGIGNENKEYLYQQLATPLVNGKTYLLSFYVTLADASNGAIKNIGAFFCSSLPTLTSFSYINVTPQIENQSGFITDTLNWVQIQGLYNALGGEQYVIFGNFNSNANTDTIKVNTTSTLTTSYPRLSYYYIDDITLIDQANVGINETLIVNDFEVYPNPTTSVLNISDKKNQYKNSIIEIKNTLGQVVLTVPFINQINLSDLSAGIYFVTFQNKENRKTIKIIKQ